MIVCASLHSALPSLLKAAVPIFKKETEQQSQTGSKTTTIMLGSCNEPVPSKLLPAKEPASRVSRAMSLVFCPLEQLERELGYTAAARPEFHVGARCHQYQAAAGCKVPATVTATVSTEAVRAHDIIRGDRRQKNAHTGRSRGFRTKAHLQKVVASCD